MTRGALACISILTRKPVLPPAAHLTRSHMLGIYILITALFLLAVRAHVGVRS